jgi:pimeloyl-ACP methyl ester carboxylesterase
MREVFVRSIRETDDGTLRAAYEALRCPVELVWGDRDTAAPLAIAKEAAAILASAHLTVLPGVGHLTPTEAPDALRAAIGARL